MKPCRKFVIPYKLILIDCIVELIRLTHPLYDFMAVFMNKSTIHHIKLRLTEQQT